MIKIFLDANVLVSVLNKEYPIFVTAGSAKEKLNHIMHNKYLSFCYDELCKIEGSLVTFGFNFGVFDETDVNAKHKYDPDIHSMSFYDSLHVANTVGMLMKGLIYRFYDHDPNEMIHHHEPNEMIHQPTDFNHHVYSKMKNAQSLLKYTQL